MPVEIECGTGVPPVDDAVIRKYTWGLDLAGLNGQINSLESAGGIGGLLAAYDTRGTPVTYDDLDDVVFAYDANGNVTNVFRWSALSAQAATIAHYEYDPYGNVINDLSGQVYAAENPWRFSTKPFDAETGLGNWGYRYYSPTLGRWMNRDPIHDPGHLTIFLQREDIRPADIVRLAASSYDAYRFLTQQLYVRLRALANETHALSGGRIRGDGQLYVYVYNWPTSTIDPFGDAPPVWVAECGAGAAIGGIRGFIGGLISGGSWRSAGCGAAAGAISGCCKALVCANLPGACTLGSCVCGAIASVAGQACNNSLEPDFCSVAAAAASSIAGCLSGAAWDKGNIVDEWKDRILTALVGVNISQFKSVCTECDDFISGL
jgi:RHS repeat-associated protein